jgi:hypothetical protein
MTRPDHTAVPPADVIAADIGCMYCGKTDGHDMAYLHPTAPAAQAGDRQKCLGCDGTTDPDNPEVMCPACAEGAAPTAAQAAGRGDTARLDWLERQCFDVLYPGAEYATWQARGGRMGEAGGDGHLSFREAIDAAMGASHAPHATLAASRDAESATSDAPTNPHSEG